MEAVIKNVPPIEELSINLDKKLTIFTGPNRSGKTIASYLLYGVYESLLNLVFYSLKLNEAGMQSLNFEDYFNDDKIDFEDMLLNNINLIFIPNKNSMLSLTEYHMKKLLRSPLYSNREVFIKKFSKIENRMKFVLTKGISKTIDIFFSQIIGDIKSSILNKNMSDLDKSAWIEKNTKTLLPKINKSIVKFDHKFNNRFKYNLFFLPAERNTLTSFSGDIVRSSFLNDLDDELPSQGINYPKPVLDFILKVDSLQDHLRPNNIESYNQIADKLLKKLLGGTLKIGQFGNFEGFYDELAKAEIPYHLTASSIKSLTGLDLYLRYWARGRNDVLFIDEPELNLHPDNQLIVARVIAQMVNAGIKVYVSTHSDYIVRQLNNLIILGSSEGKERDALVEKYGFEASELLNYEDVQSYLFHTDRSPELMPTTREGIITPTIDNVIRSLEKQTEEIYRGIIL